ncbi:uncharacterized protein B0I36DRAFT_364922 [Microdochium trichocladiopsis]|uniref:TMEM205-like domain-containing protein n=1 Tax=Microdochium trichocladiopsis TaxID=1682393 RepID=A0A9P8Y2M2_9PEZI|nr:uncharacterized protein B0I36DRAFT_364922 [Microdochium trichocladiopsis]KAH7027768.1 hypothetical protein B0I36DRAFT_364922 [Microdochium trichocladiopsis]
MLAPVHLLSYSALLGMQLWQSFAVTKITFQALPRSAFTTLNKRIFRAYFLTQSVLVLVTAVTTPTNNLLTLLSWLPLLRATTTTTTTSDNSSSPSTATWGITFAIMSVSSLLNLFLWEPRSRQAMIDRTHQETRDGRNKQPLALEPTPEMQAVNKRFKRSHAMCIHLNLVTIGSTLFWGWVLAARLRFE